jgi:hypothetical protein
VRVCTGVGLGMRDSRTRNRVRGRGERGPGLALVVLLLLPRLLARLASSCCVLRRAGSFLSLAFSLFALGSRRAL